MEEYLDNLIALHRAEPQFHSPDFDSNLQRIKNEYLVEVHKLTPVDDPFVFLDSIKITKSSVTSGQTLL